MPTSPVFNAESRASLGLLFLDMLQEGGAFKLLAAVAGLEVVVGLSALNAIQLMRFWLDHSDEESRTARAELVGGRRDRNAKFRFDLSEPRWRAFFDD